MDENSIPVPWFCQTGSNTRVISKICQQDLQSRCMFSVSTCVNFSRARNAAHMGAHGRGEISSARRIVDIR